MNNQVKHTRVQYRCFRSLPERVYTPVELQQMAEHQKRQLMGIAREKIAPLQDAVDLNIATNTEKSALTEWRKCRVLLNRVDYTTAPNIQWPEQQSVIRRIGS
ncbi:tail fiber assembly protein [Xenorhabdus bovienii]|nr:tail fiber assembly protein [Xenorhabdus bovienii]